MITFFVSQRTDGIDCAVCDWNGEKYFAQSRHGVSMSLARKLVDAGCSDQPWEARDQNGKIRFYGASLHQLSRAAIKETDTTRLKVVAFNPFPSI